MKKLSVVIPAYNEERFITSLLEKVLAVPTESLGFSKEVIVVDDGSKDRTFALASAFQEVRCLQQANQGKGRAVQYGISQASGDYVIVQDADLEYNPQDYLPMLQILQEHPGAVVYGSRPMGIHQKGRSSILPGKLPEQELGAWLANGLLTLWIALLYQRRITDSLTAYKLYPLSLLKRMQIKTHGFETDHELTAKLIKMQVPIVEVPIDYIPRSREEGKKIKASDGLKAVWTLLRFRFSN